MCERLRCPLAIRQLASRKPNSVAGRQYTGAERRLSIAVRVSSAGVGYEMRWARSDLRAKLVGRSAALLATSLAKRATPAVARSFDRNFAWSHGVGRRNLLRPTLLQVVGYRLSLARPRIKALHNASNSCRHGVSAGGP